MLVAGDFDIHFLKWSCHRRCHNYPSDRRHHNLWQSGIGSSRDPLSFFGVVVLLRVVSVVARFIPALRATKMDPISVSNNSKTGGSSWRSVRPPVHCGQSNGVAATLVRLSFRATSNTTGRPPAF